MRHDKDAGSNCRAQPAQIPEQSNPDHAAGAEPKVSIIIATKNAADRIESCIDSIIAQTYQPCEVLVQDALSTDGTLAVLQNYDPGLVKVTTEADDGIYDAWNRALTRAVGEWIMFLGADDRLAHAEVLSNRVKMLARSPRKVDLVCGRIGLIGSDGTVQKQSGAGWNWRGMLRYQTVSHIGLMHHRRLFETFGYFSTRYTIGGDYEFLLRLGPDINSVFVDEIEILAGAHGLSQTQVFRVLLETFQIQRARRDIGNARASVNLLSAVAKALYRRSRQRTVDTMRALT
jgi:glycosyltransferase involved in cell wall biosynthesis